MWFCRRKKQCRRVSWAPWDWSLEKRRSIHHLRGTGTTVDLWVRRFWALRPPILTWLIKRGTLRISWTSRLWKSHLLPWCFPRSNLATLQFAMKISFPRQIGILVGITRGASKIPLVKFLWVQPGKEAGYKRFQIPFPSLLTSGSPPASDYNRCDIWQFNESFIVQGKI